VVCNRLEYAVQLVVNTFGACLRKEGERFLVRAGDRELVVSAHKVQSILITTGVMLTSDAVQLASQHNIDIVFLSPHGDPYSRIWQTRMGSTAAIRRRQLEVAEGAEGLALAVGWVQAKVRHAQEFLEELSRRRPGTEADFASVLAGLEGCLVRLGGLSGTLDEQRGTMMGLEGTAGRVYFACLSTLLPENYRFDGRSRQPARDAFNAALNYALGVLYALVEKACICAGLDPFVGFLHTDNYAKKSLVFDLIEPFRILAERTVVLLFTGRRMQTDYFEQVPGGVQLSKEGRAALLTSFNERLDKTIRYPVQSRPGKTRNIRQRDVIQHEAHALANVLLGRNDLPRVVETRKLWEEKGDQAQELEEEESPLMPEGDELPQVEEEEPPC
jgi:CRISPR-associated protein Cas1